MFDSTCKQCFGPVAAGQLIAGGRHDEGWVHALCHRDQHEVNAAVLRFVVAGDDGHARRTVDAVKRIVAWRFPCEYCRSAYPGWCCITKTAWETRSHKARTDLAADLIDSDTHFEALVEVSLDVAADLRLSYPPPWVTPGTHDPHPESARWHAAHEAKALEEFYAAYDHQRWHDLGLQAATEWLDLI